MGVPRLYLGVFLRKNKNKSDSTSIQITSKAQGKYKVVKTIGCSNNEQDRLPESKHTKTKLLKMDDEQAELYRIIEKNF